MTIERMLSRSCWQLSTVVNGFADSTSNELATQVAGGRSFQLIYDFSKKSFKDNEFGRIEVRLLEDGYHCWLDVSEVMERAFTRGPWNPILFPTDQIQKRLPSVMKWIDQVATRENKYLWGGTIGPNFDCSGLIQTAFASQGIWLPRDAYQQEKFCETLKISSDNYQILRPGDLLFFGPTQRCTHVAIYRGEGIYCHSSGIINGRNGIGFDGLQLIDKSAVACYYRSKLRGAGRVNHCHDGVTLP